MTGNQIAFANFKETQVHNRNTEAETERSNIARETETHRSNLANETENHRANVARETETNRSNLAREKETNRSNLANEAETHRSNIARETETNRSNLAREYETNRSNVARENETSRSNKAQEALRQQEIDISAMQQQLEQDFQTWRKAGVIKDKKVQAAYLADNVMDKVADDATKELLGPELSQAIMEDVHQRGAAAVAADLLNPVTAAQYYADKVTKFTEKTWNGFQDIIRSAFIQKSTPHGGGRSFK